MMQFLYYGEYSEVSRGSAFGSCCGARYGGTEALAIENGINLYEGVVKPESESDSFVVKHIQTRNGVLTVSIQKKWVK